MVKNFLIYRNCLCSMITTHVVCVPVCNYSSLWDATLVQDAPTWKAFLPCLMHIPEYDSTHSCMVYRFHTGQFDQCHSYSIVAWMCVLSSSFLHAYMNQNLIRTLRIIVSVVPLFSILLFLDSLFSSLFRSWRVRKKYHCEADENLAQRWLHTRVSV